MNPIFIIWRKLTWNYIQIRICCTKNPPLVLFFFFCQRKTFQNCKEWEERRKDGIKLMLLLQRSQGVFLTFHTSIPLSFHSDSSHFITWWEGDKQHQGVLSGWTDISAGHEERNTGLRDRGRRFLFFLENFSNSKRFGFKWKELQKKEFAQYEHHTVKVLQKREMMKRHMVWLLKVHVLVSVLLWVCFEGEWRWFNVQNFCKMYPTRIFPFYYTSFFFPISFQVSFSYWYSYSPQIPSLVKKYF